MNVRVKCPASCGELMQGWIEGSEKLISYPIDWYSEVIIEEQLSMQQSPQLSKNSKVWAAFQKTCAYFGLEAAQIPRVSITVSSSIPVAKGMASSTADIAATVLATATLLGYELNSQQLAQICLSMEATDSTIFPSLTLFDHLLGKTIVESQWIPTFHVLVLEPMDTLITEVFRKDNHQQLLLANYEQLSTAYKIYQQAVGEQSVSKLGEAATMSAIANQRILPKKRFQDLCEIVNKSQILGINVAHSGTVIGLMYDDKRTDVEALIRLLDDHKIKDDYPKYHIKQSVIGGPRIV